MEIDITQFFRVEEHSDYSASAAELGPNAGKITWAASMKRAEVPPCMLDTDDKLNALRDYMRGFGAWEDSEIAAWTPQECNAMFIQEVASRIRESDIDTLTPNWRKYRKWAENNGGHFYPARKKVYFYLGC